MIGTRKSMLAQTQCRQFKRRLESFAPADMSFDLKAISTLGDQKTDKPLWQMEGQHFFTKELDHLLENKEVHMVIHSHKDLGTSRPQGFEISCLSPRSYPHDLLITSPHFMRKLQHHFDEKLIIGTSSPRRIENLNQDLSDYLPKLTPETRQDDFQYRFDFKVIRGNINTRLSKLQNGEYDALILAWAGIERMTEEDESYHSIKEVTKDCKVMILPLSTFPCAQAQGALAIETHKDHTPSELKEVFKKAHDLETQECIKRERQAFHQYGGGCHLPVGIYVKKIEENIFLHIHRGRHNNQRIDKRYLEINNKIIDLKELIDHSKIEVISSDNNPLIEIKKIHHLSLKKAQQIFVTSTRPTECLNQTDSKIIEDSVLWCSGTRTWKHLAKLGYWVTGSADSLGHEEIQYMQESKSLSFFGVDTSMSTILLGNQYSQSEFGHVSQKTHDIIEKSYVSKEKYHKALKFVQERLDKVKAIYWPASSYYDIYSKHFDMSDKIHLCGLGKTWKELRAKGLKNLYPAASMKEVSMLKLD